MATSPYALVPILGRGYISTNHRRYPGAWFKIISLVRVGIYYHLKLRMIKQSPFQEHAGWHHLDIETTAVWFYYDFDPL